MDGQKLGKEKRGEKDSCKKAEDGEERRDLRRGRQKKKRKRK